MIKENYFSVVKNDVVTPVKPRGKMDLTGYIQLANLIIQVLRLIYDIWNNKKRKQHCNQEAS